MIKIILFYLCMCVCMFTCLQVPVEAERGHLIRWRGVPGACEPSDGDAGF